MIGLFVVDAERRKTAVDLAGRLGSDAVVVDGPVRQSLQRMWPKLDAVVLFQPTGAAVRVLAPQLKQEESAPAIVCVNEYAIVLAVGSSGSGNALADRVAEILNLMPVPSAGHDSTGDTALEQLVGMLDAGVEGDLTGCAAAMLDGEPIRLLNPLGFPLPELPDNIGDAHGAQWTVLIDDRVADQTAAGEVIRIVPRTLVVGLGASRGVTGDEVTSMLSMLEWDFGLDLRAVRAFASIDLKAKEPGILQAVDDWSFWHGDGALGADAPRLLTYPASTLATVRVPNPSPVVLEETGTPSVAEASALHAAGLFAEGRVVELVVPKTKSENVTVAVARIRP
jgi:cobalt-precorrin 5A hydrolase / precorrin-3B C17-methyltransferase